MYDRNYRSSHIYLAYLLVATLFFFIAPVTKADCQWQLSAATRTGHVIYGPTADDESKFIPPDTAQTYELEDGTVVFSEVFTLSYNAGAVAPAPLRDLLVYQSHTVDSIATNLGTCTVTTVDDETGQFPVWSVKFTRVYDRANPEGLTFEVLFFGQGTVE